MAVINPAYRTIKEKLESIILKVINENLSGYLQTSDVKDNLTSTDTNKPLSANQGKELKSLIDGKSDNGHTHSQYLTSHQSLSGYLQTTDVKNNLTSTDTDKPLSAYQGKLLDEDISALDSKIDNLEYDDIGGNLVVSDEGIQAQGLAQIINQIISRLMAKSPIDHTHSGYASTSHTHGTWSSTSITNGTLYYNSAIRMCSLRYSRTFSSGSANTMYEWGQLIPSGYRPKYMISGSGNRNGATITIDSDGYVYGRFALAFSSSTDFYYHIMWHY